MEIEKHSIVQEISIGDRNTFICARTKQLCDGEGELRIVNLAAAGGY